MTSPAEAAWRAASVYRRKARGLREELLRDVGWTAGDKSPLTLNTKLLIEEVLANLGSKGNAALLKRLFESAKEEIRRGRRRLEDLLKITRDPLRRKHMEAQLKQFHFANIALANLSFKHDDIGKYEEIAEKFKRFGDALAKAGQ